VGKFLGIEIGGKQFAEGVADITRRVVAQQPRPRRHAVAAPFPKSGVRDNETKRIRPPLPPAYQSQIRIGEPKVVRNAVFLFGPETVRPSGPSGMAHSPIPCGPSSCAKRSTWAKWP